MSKSWITVLLVAYVNKQSVRFLSFRWGEVMSQSRIDISKQLKRIASPVLALFLLGGLPAESWALGYHIVYSDALIYFNSYYGVVPDSLIDNAENAFANLYHESAEWRYNTGCTYSNPRPDPGTNSVINGVPVNWLINRKCQTQTATLYDAIMEGLYAEAYCPRGTPLQYWIAQRSEGYVIDGNSSWTGYYAYCMDIVWDTACDDSCAVGNPIYPETQEKIESEIDYVDPARELVYSRTYRSSQFQGFQVGSSSIKSGLLDLSAAAGTPSNLCVPESVQTTDPATNAVVTKSACKKLMAQGRKALALMRPSGRTIQFSNTTSGVVPTTKFGGSVSSRTNSASETEWVVMQENNDVEIYGPKGELRERHYPSGRVTSFMYSDGTSGANGGFVLDATDTETTTALPANLLIRQVDTFGRVLSFGYDAYSNMTRLIQPDGGRVDYLYNDNGTLQSVVYPDNSIKQYLYNESALTSGANLPYAMTGRIDENGVRYASFSYDASGNAIQSVHHSEFGDINQFSFTSLQSGAVTRVVDPLNATRDYGLQTVKGSPRVVSVSQPGGSGCSAASSAVTYDANGNVASSTDFNGNKTTFDSYDLTRNLELQRTEAAGTGVARQITTQWHPTWRLESRRAEPKLITTSVYNGQPDPTNGNAVASCAPATAYSYNAVPIAVLCKKVEQATSDETGTQGLSATAVGTPRIWTYSYNQYGQVLTATDPLAHTTSYSYYTDTSFNTAGEGHTVGDLWKETNPLGQVTEYTSYDQNGRLLSSRDPNGAVTENFYTPRGWLQAQYFSHHNSSRLTSYTYDKVGQLKTVTLPGGLVSTYSYDAAHRLTGITDNRGNSIIYTLDAAGNRIQEDIKDPSGVLVRTTQRVFDQLGRLQNEKYVAY